MEGAGKDHDFSFSETADLDQVTITGNSPAADGQLQAQQCWTALWCKDYGGKCKIKVTLTTTEGSSELREVSLPVDEDNDGIADLWERQQIQAWNAQYGENLRWETTQDIEQNLKPDEDAERPDPDGPGPLVAQAVCGRSAACAKNRNG